jgi:hypothetical protein
VSFGRRSSARSLRHYGRGRASSYPRAARSAGPRLSELHVRHTLPGDSLGDIPSRAGAVASVTTGAAIDIRSSRVRRAFFACIRDSYGEANARRSVAASLGRSLVGPPYFRSGFDPFSAVFRAPSFRPRFRAGARPADDGASGRTSTKRLRTVDPFRGIVGPTPKSCFLASKRSSYPTPVRLFSM